MLCGRLKISITLLKPVKLFKAKSNLCFDGLFFPDNDANNISRDEFSVLLGPYVRYERTFASLQVLLLQVHLLMYLLVATILAGISLSSHNRYLQQDIFFSYIQLDVIFKHFFSQCFLILFLSSNFLFSYPFAF